MALIFDDFYSSWIGDGPPLVKIATLVQRTDWPTPLSIYARDEQGARRVAAFLKKAVPSAKITIAFEPAFRRR